MKKTVFASIMALAISSAFAIDKAKPLTLEEVVVSAHKELKDEKDKKKDTDRIKKYGKLEFDERVETTYNALENVEKLIKAVNRIGGNAIAYETSVNQKAGQVTALVQAEKDILAQTDESASKRRRMYRKLYKEGIKDLKGIASSTDALFQDVFELAQTQVVDAAGDIKEKLEVLPNDITFVAKDGTQKTVSLEEALTLTLENTEATQSELANLTNGQDAIKAGQDAIKAGQDELAAKLEENLSAIIENIETLSNIVETANEKVLAGQATILQAILVQNLTESYYVVVPYMNTDSGKGWKVEISKPSKRKLRRFVDDVRNSMKKLERQGYSVNLKITLQSFNDVTGGFEINQAVADSRVNKVYKFLTNKNTGFRSDVKKNVEFAFAETFVQSEVQSNKDRGVELTVEWQFDTKVVLD